MCINATQIIYILIIYVYGRIWYNALNIHILNIEHNNLNNNIIIKPQLFGWMTMSHISLTTKLSLFLRKELNCFFSAQYNLNSGDNSCFLCIKTYRLYLFIILFLNFFSRLTGGHLSFSQNWMQIQIELYVTFLVLPKLG